MEELTVPRGAPQEPAARVEAALVERARQHDEEAFRVLVDRHRDHAYGLALRITRSPEDAEEAAQEAFVRAWLALDGFRGEAAFGTWLHRIVARRALDLARARKTREARQAGVEHAKILPARDSHATRDVLLSHRIDRLTQGLSVAQRAVVTLFYREDQPVSGIARMLEMPENTVKTHLRRARAALREAWLREEGAAP
jgi:RNA polymerase sigma-70 factor (ECF subfamily)